MLVKYNVHRFVDKHFPERKVVSSGREANVNCVFHDDSRKHMYVNLSTGVFNCFSCGAKGTFYELVKVFKRNSQSVIDVLKTFETVADAQVFIEKTKVAENTGLPPAYMSLYANELNRHGKKALSYIYDRGITDVETRFYRIGYCSEGYFAGRIIVPVLTEEGAVASFIARDYTGNQKPKVLTPKAPEGSHGVKDHVFNLHVAAKTGHLLVGEGVFDAISLGVRGIALFGKKPTNRQFAKIILTKPKRITVCLDPDAVVEAKELAQKLYSYCEDIRLVFFPAGEDPSSLGSALTQSLVDASTKYIPQLSFEL